MGLPEPPGGWTSTCWSAEGILYISFYHQWKPLMTGMKISSDKTRTYIPRKNCTEAQLTPDHILECPALTPHIIRLGMVPLTSELREVLTALMRRDLRRRFRELTTLSDCPWTRQKNI
ncbi:hypothetical protein TNCV_878861 [Trichonephila clavipes]|nr:hypothetical protein TNCV_878861 [Trichonephila clavipes]